jgi:hypothetical protein
MSYNPMNDLNVQSFPIVRSALTGLSHVWFNDYFPDNDGNYVYNDQGGTGIERGRVDVSGILNQKTIQVFISAIDSTSLTIRVEGRMNQEDVWGNIYTEVFTAATAIALLWPICEYLGQIRIGILKTGSGTLDRVSVSGDFVTWKRAFK